MRHPAWFGLLLAAMAMVPFFPAMAGTPLWEDTRLIQSGTGPFWETFTKPFLGSYFRPMVSVSFWLDYRLAGGLPFQFHQTNVLLHLAATLVFWQTLRMGLVGTRAAALSAMFFAVQPAQVGAVAWIGGRTDSLAVFFVSITAWMLVKGKHSAGRAQVLCGIGAGSAFLASLLSKEQSGALLPIWLGLALGLGGRTVPKSDQDPRPGSGPNRIGQWWPWLLVFLIPTVLFAVLWARLGPESIAMPWHGSVYALILASRTALVYALLLFAPSPGPMHWTTTLPVAVVPETLAVGLWLVLMAAGGWWMVVSRRRYPVVAWSMLWILVCLLPVSNLAPLPGMVLAPWRAALSGLGAAVLSGWVADRLWQRFRWGGSVSVGALVWCLALCTWGASRWTDRETVHRTFLRFDPGSFFVVEAGAGSLLNSGKPQGAVVLAETCLSTVFGGSDWRDPMRAVQRYREDGRIRQRIRLGNGDKRQPDEALAGIFLLLGYGRMDAGRLADSRAAFETALAIAPAYPGTRLGMGRWHAAAGDPIAALGHLDAVARIRPDIPMLHGLRGDVLTRLGRPRDAARAWESEGRVQPWSEEAWLRAADAWVAAGEPGMATRLLRRVAPGTVGGGKRIGEWLAKQRVPESPLRALSSQRRP